MSDCEQKDELQRRLKVAFEEWYAVRQVLERIRKPKPPRKKFITFSVHSGITLRSTDATGTSGALKCCKILIALKMPAVRGVKNVQPYGDNQRGKSRCFRPRFP